MSLFELLGSYLNSVYEFKLFIGSGWLVVRLAPVCFVLESLLTYVYFKRIKQYESDEKRRIALKVFWKIIKYKILIIVVTLLLIVDRNGNVESIAGLRVFKYYYLYTLGVVVAFFIYLFKKSRFLPLSSGVRKRHSELDNTSKSD